MCTRNAILLYDVVVLLLANNQMEIKKKWKESLYDRTKQLNVFVRARAADQYNMRS